MGTECLDTALSCLMSLAYLGMRVIDSVKLNKDNVIFAFIHDTGVFGVRVHIIVDVSRYSFCDYIMVAQQPSLFSAPRLTPIRPVHLQPGGTF